MRIDKLPIRKLLLAAAVGALALWAQPGNRGTVIGQVNAPGAPAGSVVVVISGPSEFRSVHADAKGAFVFGNVAPGQYEVRATAQDLCPLVTQVTVAAGQIAPVNFDFARSPRNQPCAAVLPLVKGKQAGGIQAPAFGILRQDLRELLSRSAINGKQGASLYASLGDADLATLLNIYAKMSATAVMSGKPLFSYMQAAVAFSGDSWTFQTVSDISPLLRSTPAFHAVTPVLRGSFLPDCTAGGSYKSSDSAAILHIVLCYSKQYDFANVHIDANSGVAEAITLMSRLPKEPATSPYAIHDLLENQNIPTGYRLK